MIKQLLVFLNSLVWIVMALSCLSCYVSPNTFWYISFLGLGYPYVVLVTIAFLLFWMVKRHRFFWLNLLALVLSSKFILLVFGVNFVEKQTEQGLKIMSYNVKNFDLYNWTGNKQTRSKIMQLIASENPDIICFQEFYSDYKDFNNQAYITDSLGYKHVFFHKTFDKKIEDPKLKNGQRIQFGLSIFSRYEITDTGDLNFTNSINNDCIYADVKIKNQKVRVYNTHLQSIHLGYDDYDTLEEIEENQNAQWYRIKNIIRKFKRAYSIRAKQADWVDENVKSYSGTKILCGDFNDVPVSYAHQRILGNMKDAFSEKGKGFGKTYVNDLGFFRIDNILFESEIKINSYKTIQKKLSDHYPVVVTFDLQ